MSATIEKKIWIPEVPKDQLTELAKRIRPVYQFPQKGKCYLKPVDIFGASFIWDPRAAESATGLKPLCEIKTYHTYGAPVFFKPSVAEVLAQIPAEHLDKVVAFEITDSPDDAEDLNREIEALHAGYHVAKTQLYIRE